MTEFIVFTVIFDLVATLVGILFLGTSTQVFLAMALVLGITNICIFLGIGASELLDKIL